MPGTIPDSQVLEFYNGAKVFVTGGTGFLGKALICKLLRTMNLDHVYILVRVKKGKDPQTRLKDIFQDQIFKFLRNDVPDFEKKVTCIQGDVSLPKLGMNENDIDFLTKEVSHVFHSAATVRFNETLRTSIPINVLGTYEIIEFCKKCIHLKIFAHVSTAYSNCHIPEIKEEFYEPPCSGETARSLRNILSGEKLDSITDELIKPWFNTYSFTKAIAENVIKENAKSLPVLVFRPSIIMGSYQEPVPGWIDNIYGPTGIIVACGAGLLRCIHADQTKEANLVPVDLVINALICSAWDVGTQFNNNSKNISNSIENIKVVTDNSSKTSTIPIYNFVSTKNNSITWGKFLKLNLKHGKEYPIKQTLWYYMCTLTTNAFWYRFLTIFLHYIPALLFDSLLFLTGKKPQLWNAYKKIHTMSQVMICFAMNSWRFSDQNVQKLWDKLSDADKKLFYFDMKPMDWDLYMKTVVLGIRKFIFQEDDSTIPSAKRKFILLWVVYQLLRGSMVGATLWVLSKAFFLFGGFSEKPFEEATMTAHTTLTNTTLI